ncbi:hypothetical protein ACFY0G_02160 [Streptomyces sp. NPDC001552]|uniref:hypothetical protein n=1 Tax=Streptomyces sp. NPDC001552 TaxID=3364587 RepID=UPI0036B56F58
MPKPPARCAAATRTDPSPCEGPQYAVLIRGPFMSRARDAMSTAVPACVHHGVRLFTVLHAGRIPGALYEGRITPGPDGDDQAVADLVARILAASECPPVRCAAAYVLPDTDTDCDGRHDAVEVRGRFSARIAHSLPAPVPGCVEHGALLLARCGGGRVAPGPGGTDQDATTARARAEELPQDAWGTLPTDVPRFPAGGLAARAIMGASPPARG